MVKMIDTHAHLDDEYYNDIDDVIKKMNDNIIIVSGVDSKTNNQVLNLISKYKNVYGTIGIHPEYALNYKSSDLDFIKKNITNPKIVGIGEIGLDYHYDIDKNVQKQLFVEQIKIANKYKKTMVIHSRDAVQDTYDLLKKYKLEDVKVDIHCYSSSLEMAEKFLKINAKFGVGGVLTFKNAKSIKEIVSKLDMKNFLLETDSPFLTPEPHRGEKNEPYNIIFVAKKIAEIKEIPLEEVLEKTTNNAIDQFDLKI